MNIIFLTGLYPKEQEQEIFDSCINGVQTATDALQWSFVDGFCALVGNIDLITLPYVGSYPRRNKKFLFREGEFKTNTGLKYHGVKFCNLSMYKMYSRYVNTRKILFNKYKNNRDTVLVLYSVSTPFLKAARDLKKKNPGIKICVIIADLPQFMSDSKNLLYRLFKRIDTKTVYRNLKYVDSFVLLSKHMTEMIPINDKPFVVVEGIYNPNDEVNVSNGLESNKKIILYSGTLARRYGVMNLVNAVMSIEDQSVLLYICGEGDSKQDIMSLSSRDHRIRYKGNLIRQQVLELQRKSTLLINPRTPEGDYTKYSFPSKIMEYFASGTPTLMYRLPGIPEEYYNYCYTIDELGVEALSMKLGELLSLPQTALKQKGESARDFILTRKNPQSQCVKVIKMLQGL